MRYLGMSLLSFTLMLHGANLVIMSIQTVKNIQRFFMDSDYRMYHATTNTPAIARSDRLQEELGRVTHLFRQDWHLTCNEMELLKVCVDGACTVTVPHGLFPTTVDLIPEPHKDSTPTRQQDQSVQELSSRFLKS